MAHFDQFSGNYKERHNRNIAISGEDTDFFTKLKLKLLRENLGTDADAELLLLDVGAGIGKVQQFVREQLPKCRSVGVDVSRESLKTARDTAGEDHFFAVYDGGRLPFRDGRFDVVLFCTVLHHVPPELRPALFAEAAHVMKNEGRLFVFEHNPANPLTRRVVGACEFDADAQLLRAGNCIGLAAGQGLEFVKLNYFFFFPGFLRWLRPLEKYMAWLPLGGQYMLIFRKRVKEGNGAWTCP